MKIDDIISKATHTTGRALLVVGGLVLLGKLFGHNLADFPILATAKNMPEGMVELAMFVLVGYLLAARSINWQTDASSYTQKRAQTAFELLRMQEAVRDTDSSVDQPDYTNTHSKELSKANRNSEKSENLVIGFLHLYIPIFIGALALIALSVGFWKN